MKITIIGTGYVGLVSGICFASLGHDVACIDKDESKINTLNQGEIPIYEPGLKEMLAKCVETQKITFSTDLKSALNGSKAVFIAVGTPQDQDGSADLSYVLSAAKEITEIAPNPCLIVTKSTVPVGTAAKIKAIASEKGFLVASNPEFLREGNAIQDFMEPDRIVIGVDNEESDAILSEIYAKFPAQKLVKTDTKTAELTKYAANSFLATKISFINEIADLCQETGADIKKLAHAIGLDSRIGEKFLNPGPGFGGSCFPKDILAITSIASDHNVNLSLINSVIASNKTRQADIANKIAANLAPNAIIALLGLAFKANTDDIRYSPALNIAQNLLQKGLKIKATDPQAIKNAQNHLKNAQNIEFYPDFYDAIAGSDLILIATEWQDYQNLDFNKVKTLTDARKIVDLRNLFDAKFVENHGFEYDFIGKKHD